MKKQMRLMIILFLIQKTLKLKDNIIFIIIYISSEKVSSMIHWIT